MNLFALPPLPLSGETTELLAQGGKTRIERIVSTGQTTDWYDQEETEFVVVLQGEGELEYADGTIEKLRAGDFKTIPPHQRHRVCRTSESPPCIWLCVFWS